MATHVDEISEITNRIDPAKTILFLGAGAAIPSGAPSAIELCRWLEEKLASSSRISDDLAEVASILEQRTSRKRLVQSVVDRLKDLQPDGGLKALAEYQWAGIYTTNYDRLIELAFDSSKNEYAVVRSHFDWENVHNPSVTPIYKIHGCVSQDRSMGHKASMIITYEDYDRCLDYRELLFGRLKGDFGGGDTVVIGYSIQDPDIQEVLQSAISLQQKSEAPGRLHLATHRSPPGSAGEAARV